MNYTKDEGLNFEIDSCDTIPVNHTVRGYPVTAQCKCNSCTNSCKYEMKTTLPILEGFSITTVGLCYFIVLIFTFLIYIIKYLCKKRNPFEHSRTSSFDSDFNKSRGSSTDSNSNSKSNLTNTNKTTNSRNNINANITK